jgi:hypothetical protein
VLGLLAAGFVLLGAAAMARRAILFRSHRDAGNFAGYSVAAAVLVVLALSFVILPDLWSGVGDLFNRIYNGG